MIKLTFAHFAASGFCSKCIHSKMARQLLGVHSDKPKMRDIKLLTKQTKERNVELEILINEGNLKHNMEVLKAGCGQIVVARRSSIQHQHENCAKDFLPCEYCKKFVLKSSLWFHSQNCTVWNFFNGGHQNADVTDSEETNDEDDGSKHVLSHQTHLW